MPVFKPGGKIDIVLDCDAGEQSPLVFVCSALSVAGSNDLGDQLDALLETPGLTERDRQARLQEIVSPLIHDWRNAPCEYSWAAMLENIGPTDLWSLAYAIKRQLGYREKKS